MKKFLTSIIALCLCLAISLLAVGCGGGNPYKTFVKKWGTHSADIEVKTGSINKDYVIDRYSLTGKYEGYHTGTFAVRMNEVTVETGESGSYDDTSISMDFSIHYSQSKDEITVYLDRYNFFEGSTTLEKANISGFKYEFNDGVTLDGQSAQDQAELTEKNRFVFDANKYFDDNKLSLEDATETITLDSKDLITSQTTSVTTWIENHKTWSDDMLADLLDAVNATLAEVDKMMEAKMAK